ncbi:MULTISPECIES: 8-oxoguanine DNA glycosylase OGG fold protein [Nocardiaceae]|uniref:8-oxoguanine DNA glycosylase OGG fold protein n=1 Tax=Nocardiaceae TaxID=85025 RepID=UPI000691C63C|nr:MULTISPECIES: hypothetical protein [Rhodococcus]OZD12011.1 hypothetical protein CH248_28800 [Rhodococcus sp. 06-156-4a]OZD15776.1 hypothetical protein CH253_22680 [Rhodococcus sp. 06-156-3C]OZD21160.1 hypothetical protein CH280_02910 [Rhodococcus sp. 06-156-4C]OZD32342.1 hypothetical protein CH284_20840 [Rhodococcus sp. 06-156-3]OZD36564.1 hypothetical protein CH247_03265 [Rhodococcus sp. 06-156-3b]
MAKQATDLSALQPPIQLERWLETEESNRKTIIVDHSIKVDLTWWNNSLRQLSAIDHPLEINGRDRGEVALARGHIFAAAQQLTNPEDVWPILWLSMAWGTGSRRRLVHKRMRSFSLDRLRYQDALYAAAALARTQPRAAYDAFLRDQKPLVTYFGPAFFTKYLYFAGRGNPGHPSLILDSRVATALRLAGWRSLDNRGSWPASTYQRYCDLIETWTNELLTRSRTRPARDVLERWLFDNAAFHQALDQSGSIER